MPASTPPRSGPPHTGIVVVNYGSHRLLSVNLPPDGPKDLTVVVVDNLHSASERAAVGLLAGQRDWALVALEGNLGFGGGVNAGVEHARSLGCDVVVLLNPDARIAPEGVAALAARVREEPDLLVGPRIVRPDGNVWFRGAVVDVPGGRTRAVAGIDHDAGVPWLTGACVAFDPGAWTRTGGFDDEYFMYWEDVDLSARWVESGGRLAFADDVEVVHDVGGTQESRTGKSTLYYRYNCRNRLMFAAKHLPDDDLRRWVRSTPGYAKEVVLRGGRRQFLRHPVRPWLAAARGSLEGLKLARGRLRA